MKPEDWKKIKHFKPSDFPKKPDAMVLEAVQAMDQLCEISGVEIYIHVGWDDDGHSPKSYHYRGLAVDFHFVGHTDYEQQLAWIESIDDFGGIGFYPDWRPHGGWHADLRPKQDKEGNRLYWVGRMVTITEPKTKKLVRKQVYSYGKGVLQKAL